MKIICPECHYVGKPAKKKRGSTKMEVLAWLMFPFGLPYTFWRMLSKTDKCKYCENTLLIDANSPVGKTLIAKMEEDPLPELVRRINEPAAIHKEQPGPSPAPSLDDKNIW